MKNDSLHALLEYKPYFESRPQFDLSEQGSWYVYSDKMHEFAARVSAENCTDYIYNDTIQKYGVQDNVKAAIATADVELCHSYSHLPY